MVYYDIPAGSFTIEFTLTSGEIKQINVSGGFMYRRYSINAPQIDCYENAEIYFQFANMGRDYAVFYPDGSYFAAISDLYKWTFVEAEALQDAADPKYNIKMILDYYTYDFDVYGDSLIKIYDNWYRVTNRNLDDLFEKMQQFDAKARGNQQ
jgi:hypothetical protein